MNGGIRGLSKRMTVSGVLDVYFVCFLGALAVVRAPSTLRTFSCPVTITP